MFPNKPSFYLGRILEFKPFEALVDDIRDSDYWKSDNRGSFALIQFKGSGQ